jgi:hypothetical protein
MVPVRYTFKTFVITNVPKKLMSIDGPRFSNLIGSIIRHEVSKVHQKASGYDKLTKPYQTVFAGSSRSFIPAPFEKSYHHVYQWTQILKPHWVHFMT